MNMMGIRLPIWLNMGSVTRIFEVARVSIKVFFVITSPRACRGTYKWLKCAWNTKHNGRKVYCYYKCREDYFQKSKGQHKHKPSEETLEAFLSRNRKMRNSNATPIYQALGELSAITGISLENTCSDDMFHIIYDAIRMGQAHPHTEPEKLIPKIGRDKLREIIISGAERKRDEIMSRFATERYCAITLDAGTVGKEHFLDFVLVSRKGEFILKVLHGPNLNTEQYAAECISALILAAKYGVKISNFVGDGLKCQVNALNGMHPKCIQNKKEIRDNPNFSRIGFSPCIIHRIQLSIIHTERNNVTFSEALRCIKELSLEFRRYAAYTYIGTICPEPIATRWLFMFDIAVWLKVHRQECRRYWRSQGREEEQLPDWLDLFIELIDPFKGMVKKFSQLESNVTDIYPIIHLALDRLSDIMIDEDMFPDWDGVRSMLIERLKELTINSGEGNYFTLAFSLVSAGRYEILVEEKESKSAKLGPEGSRKTYELPRVFVPDNANDFNINLNHDAVMTEEVNEIDSETFFDLNLNFPTNVNMFPEVQDDILTNDSISDCSISPMFHNCVLGLRAQLRAWNIPVEERTAAVRCFDKWVRSNVEDLPDYELLSPTMIEFWENVYRRTINQDQASKGWNLIADLALRLLSTPASEIACDRTISYQGYLTAKRRRRSGIDLRNARLVQYMARAFERKNVDK